MIKKIYDADETDFVGHHEKPICSQLIYEFRISDTLLNTTLKSVKKLDYVKNHNNLRSHNGFLFKENEFLDLKNFCLEKISSVYQKYYDSGKIQITQSWATKSGTRQCHHPHCHPNSIMSSILYLTDSDACTWFSVKDSWYDPFSFLNVDLLGLGVMGEYAETKIHVIHKEKSIAGKMILFPSMFHHSVSENNSVDTRYTINCNTFIEGDFGDVFNVTHVNIPRV